MLTRDNVRNTVASTLQAMLGIPVGEDDNVSREATPLWDSLKSIEIVLTLEAECGVEFSPEDIAEANSQQKLVDLIVTKAGA